MYTILILSACLSVTFARIAGPPAAACGTMMPGHGDSTAVGSPPYEVIIDTMTFSAGSSVTVNVTTTDGTTFRGFFVQARVNDDDFATNPALGMFSDFPENSAGVDCTRTDGAWGHTLNTDKTSAVATWTYDGECEDIGDIAFRVSVVQGAPLTRYFTDISSDDLMFDMDMCDTGKAGYFVSSMFTIVTSIIVAVIAR